MGIGFIVTIVLLATLLGVCARQALATTEERSGERDEVDHEAPHSNAI